MKGNHCRTNAGGIHHLWYDRKYLLYSRFIKTVALG